MVPGAKRSMVLGVVQCADSCGIILERRRAVDEHLRNPPRFSPYQWRLLYMPPQGRLKWNFIIVVNGRDLGVLARPLREAVCWAAHEAIQKLRGQFVGAEVSGGQSEEVWREQADLDVAVIGRMQTSYAVTVQQVMARWRRLQRMREEEEEELA